MATAGKPKIKNYGLDFKLRAVQLSQQPGVLVKDVADSLGIRMPGPHNGAPGLRPQYHANYYAAFVIGPDGHNIEVDCHRPEA